MEPSTSPIRLLIADDHLVVRSGLTALLHKHPDLLIVGEAINGEEALKLTHTLHPDVILMDLRMPILDGIEATRRIKAEYPHSRVLILTTYGDEATVLPALEAGAVGFLLKDASYEALLAAIQAAARGEAVLTAQMMARLLARPSVTPPNALSERELEVLRWAAQGKTNKEIARQLTISEATVKTHLNHIFDKLDVPDRTAAVAVALNRKLIE